MLKNNNDNQNIIVVDYGDQHFDWCALLLDKLQEYVVWLDPLWHNFITPGFGASEIKEYLMDYLLDDLFFKVVLDENNTDTNNVIWLAIGHFECIDWWKEYKWRSIFSLDELIVDSKYRSSGIWTILIDIMESETKKRDVNEIHIWVFWRNKSAMDFYSKKGYEIRLATLVKRLP